MLQVHPLSQDCYQVVFAHGDSGLGLYGVLGGANVGVRMTGVARYDGGVVILNLHQQTTVPTGVTIDHRQQVPFV